MSGAKQPAARFDSIALKIMWDRLVSIADEMILSLVRSSFSITVREGYDLSCVLFDGNGASLAQGTFSVPGFTGTAPQTVAHMLAKFPPHTLAPGDVLITNDPWLGTGHLFDVNVLRPVFRGERLVGYALSITHLPDIGGLGMSAVAAEVYEEGLTIPIMKLVDRGQVNEPLLDLIRTNVRVPEMVIGDLMANVTCTEVGGRELIEFMDEYGVRDLAELSAAIRNQSEQAIRTSIAAIPDGVYRNAIDIEGIDRPLRLTATVRVQGDAIDIDYTGTDDPVRGAINVPFCYTKAMSWYVVKCLTIPHLPNNEGATRPITVRAPQGCILNAQRPFPTGGRHAVGHFTVPLLMGAFADALPDRVVADLGMMNVFNVQGTNRSGQSFTSLFFLAGGFGAVQGADGAATLPGPSNMMVVPTEIWENLTHITVQKREFLCDSGGAGQFRGGVGQTVRFRNDTHHLLTVAFLGQRTEFPAKGFHGGLPGRKREYLINDRPVNPKGRHVLQPGDTFTTFEAGGGGFGDPRRRDRAKVIADLEAGLVSVEAARRVYGYSPSKN